MGSTFSMLCSTSLPFPGTSGWWFSSSPSLSSWWTRLSSSLRGTTRTLCAPECQSFLKYCFKSSKNPSEQSNFLFLLPKPAEYQQDLPGTPTVGPAAQSPLLLTTTPLPTFPGASLGSFTLCINSSQSS